MNFANMAFSSSASSSSSAALPLPISPKSAAPTPATVPVPETAADVDMPQSSKPPRTKFTFDPLSMLLPHERAAKQAQQPSATRQSASAAQAASTSLVAKAQQTRQSMHASPQLPMSPPPSQVMSTPPTEWSSAAGMEMEGIEELHPDESVSVAGGHAGRERTLHPHLQTQRRRARLEDWEIVETLGTGTFGRVLLVRQRPSYRPISYHPIFPHLFRSQDPSLPSPAATQQADSQLPHFAMKVLRKTEIVRLKQVEHINSERAILERIRHPFIVELYATYQDHLNVYMLLSYIPGGELFSHLRRAGRFTADVTRFYLASIVLAIDYLHSRDIIYRDLKPENLLLDRQGYLHIADFGFAKIVEDRTFTLCGTPEYLAPEIVLSKGHGKAVDWWALGILAFEMLAGYPLDKLGPHADWQPFFDDHPLGIYEKILRNDIAFPAHFDAYAKDLIRGLLKTDRSKRLGNLRGGARDVMAHQWFSGVDWGSLERREIGAPIVPRVANMGDSQNFQRYPPPRPSELPGIFGASSARDEDPYRHLFEDFVYPRKGSAPDPPGHAGEAMVL